MSEEFKKEEINGEAAEETKAAEHTEEVKAETTAEQSAAETEKPQETAEAPKAEEKKTTTYSWVNPKISGKTADTKGREGDSGVSVYQRVCRGVRGIFCEEYGGWPKISGRLYRGGSDRRGESDAAVQ